MQNYNKFLHGRGGYKWGRNPSFIFGKEYREPTRAFGYKAFLVVTLYPFPK
jgi:hypothetical protein